MIKIYPFKAILPKPALAGQIACEPYDVINAKEARSRAAGNPVSFLHVVRPEIDFAEDQDPYDDVVYEKAAENLNRLIEDGMLEADDQESIFLYRQVFQERSQFGVVCCYDVTQYRDDSIKKHEKTRPEKEDDRTKHLTTCSAHAEPVFLCFKDDPVVTELIEADHKKEPIINFEANDGVRHTVWRVSNPQDYTSAFENVASIYIADGHHRTAAGERAATQRQHENQNHSGQEEYNRVLSVIFPASQLQILSYNRVVKDLGGLSPADFLAKLSNVGVVSKSGRAVPSRAGEMCVYVDGGWHQLVFPEESIDSNDSINSLDVALLQARVLEPILDVGDPRTDSRIGFVGGIRGTEELEMLVDSGTMAVAFSMFPTSIQQLMDVSDGNKIMPPKSTWFEPKLRSGIFVHQFEKY